MVSLNLYLCLFPYLSVNLNLVNMRQLFCQFQMSTIKPCQYIYQAIRIVKLSPVLCIFGRLSLLSWLSRIPWESCLPSAFCLGCQSSPYPLSDGSHKSGKSCLCASVSEPLGVCSHVQMHLTVRVHVYLCMISWKAWRRSQTVLWDNIGLGIEEELTLSGNKFLVSMEHSMALNFVT